MRSCRLKRNLSVVCEILHISSTPVIVDGQLNHTVTLLVVADSTTGEVTTEMDYDVVLVLPENTSNRPWTIPSLTPDTKKTVMEAVERVLDKPGCKVEMSRKQHGVPRETDGSVLGLLTITVSETEQR